jgi:hypothetical protein
MSSLFLHITYSVSEIVIQLTCQLEPNQRAQNPLEPSGWFMYHQYQHPEILHYSYRMCTSDTVMTVNAVLPAENNCF